MDVQNMNDMKIFSIAKIINNETNVYIKLDAKYAEGLKGLEGYSYMQVLWWADGCDNDKDRFVEVIKVLKKTYDMNLKKGGCFVLDYMFATTEKKLSSQYVDISTQESRLVSNIYNFVYAILKKEMNVKTKSVEAIAQMIDLKDNVDTILYMTK